MSAHHFVAGDRLVIASHNQGKIDEITALLAPFKIDVVGANALNLPEPPETAPDFIGNATLKARAVTQATALPALADDSGLVVDALDGAPGIYSARWAQTATGGRDFALAMQRVEDALQKKQQTAPNISRRARFVCALALTWCAKDDIICATYEGAVEGQVVSPPRGTRGFGYDPIFVACGHRQSFGEMSPHEKHAISHRADAFAQLVEVHFA